MFRPRPHILLMTRGLVNFTVGINPSLLMFNTSVAWTTAPVTVSQITGPNSSSYSYSWSVGPLHPALGDPIPPITVNSPTSATTTFRGLYPGSLNTLGGFAY